MTNFWDSSVWTVFLEFFIIALFIVIANIIAKNVKFIKHSLLPISVIAGLLILIIKSVWPWFNDLIDEEFMGNVTYHFLALGFIAISLKINKNKEKAKTSTVFKTGIVTVNGYLLQGIFGGLITGLLFALVSNSPLIPAAGFILPMGFGQGPGQAYNWGHIYQTEHGFVGGSDFGLTIAAIGFLVACIVGVIYLNILKKKKLIKITDKEADTKEEVVSTEGEVPLSDSVDKLTLQIVLILFTYFLTYLAMYGISALCDSGALGNFGPNTLKPLIWGFNFLIGTGLAVLIKTILSKFKKAKIMKYNYFSDYLLNRISGLCFDIMIVAGIAAIDLKAIKTLWPAIILLSVFGTVTTFIYLKVVAKKMWPGYENEGLMSMFGMLTGTASTGMILLREIDQNFDTPAADNLVYQSMPAMLFGFPMLLLVPFGASDGNTMWRNFWITIILCTLLFVVYNLILFLPKKKKAKE